MPYNRCYTLSHASRLSVLGSIILLGLAMSSCASSDDPTSQGVGTEDISSNTNTGVALNHINANVLQASVQGFTRGAVSEDTASPGSTPTASDGGLTCDVTWGAPGTTRASDTGYNMQWANIGSSTSIAILPRGAAVDAYSYTVSTTGAISSSSPYYFQTASNDVVTSWYPYNSGSLSSFTVQSDQSTLEKYIASDLLYTSSKVMATSQNLTYSHKMAQIIVDVTVSNANYLLNSEVQSLTIAGLKTNCTVTNYTKSTNEVCTPTFTAGATTATISAYPHSKSSTSTTSTATFIMCVPAQTISTSQVFTVTVGGTAYTGKLSTAQNLDWGSAYNISINISPSRYLYFNCSSVEIGYFYGKYANGQPVIIKNTSADITSASAKGITPVAMIFSKTTSSTDDTSNGWTHGYAISLKNVSTSSAWRTSGSGTDLSKQWAYDYSNATKNYDGYKYTKEIVNNKTLSNYPAFNVAYNYNVKVSGASSGWYLPSIGQWYLLIVNVGKATGATTQNDAVAYWFREVFSLATLKTNLNNALKIVGSGSYDPFYSSSDGTKPGYWSSSESAANYPVCCLYNNDDDVEFYKKNQAKTVAKYVRAVLSF